MLHILRLSKAGVDGLIHISCANGKLRGNGSHLNDHAMDEIWNKVIFQLTRRKMVKLQRPQYEEIVIDVKKRV